ncbi:ClpP/crotonase [Atractiella rhizophila]|nr:ClpP/crotonase [Atractiella rhizophila]
MEHKKLLIAALNGPAIGLSAALLGWFDFLYATEDFFLLTPFTGSKTVHGTDGAVHGNRLGLAAEGGASLTFPRRMGVGLANEALLLSRKLTAKELERAGFINRLFPKQDFLSTVLSHVRESTEDLVKESLVLTKTLIQDGLGRERGDTINMNEIFVGTERFVSGKPQERFLEIATKQRKHKL